MRLKVLLGTLGVTENVLQLVVPQLHLPVCVTYYWVHSSTPRPSHSLLQCVLLGLVYGELCRCKAMAGGKARHLYAIYVFLFVMISTISLF